VFQEKSGNPDCQAAIFSHVWEIVVNIDTLQKFGLIRLLKIPDVLHFFPQQVFVSWAR
jgi:hypothetical protein